MTTLNQLLRNRKKISKGDRIPYNRSPKLEKCPQKRAIITKIATTKPKKPNSAVRKIVKVRLSTKKYIRAVVPGQGFFLQEHSTVLIKAGRIRDIPGLHYRVIRGARDFISPERGIYVRTTGRSKYGIKKDTQLEVDPITEKTRKKWLKKRGMILPATIDLSKPFVKVTRVKKPSYKKKSRVAKENLSKSIKAQ